ncbi:MAG: amidohydrolase family protein [Candidatus Omnitrophica bacterium]|nr:amidohydrolase family protein [Candidatus Omnitrophota bacterium]
MKVIINARIITGKEKEIIENGKIFIEKDKIVSIDKNKKIPKDSEIIDAKGNTVLPGFIEGHTHLTSFPGQLDFKGHIIQNIKAVDKLQKFLFWGTTTVANAGGCPENVILKKIIEEGNLKFCSKLLVGGIINPTGGHVRGKNADGPWEVRKAVRELISEGADFIKTSATGGFMWVHEELGNRDYTYEELSALVDETHSKGKIVCVHAHANPGLKIAIESKCDVILHGVLIDEDGLEKIKEKELYYMPTLHITSEKVYNNPDLPEFMRKRMKEVSPHHRKFVEKAYKMGIKIGIGTDGGPGDIMNEICELVKCGVKPIDAIIFATKVNSEIFGIDDKVGTIEIGKKADLFIIKGDPLKNVNILLDNKNILLVMKDGDVLKAQDEYKNHLNF